MNRMNYIHHALYIGFSLMVLNPSSFSIERWIFPFSESNAESNCIEIMGAGFDSYPKAEVSFGSIPMDDTSQEITDGKGLIVTADPGEGIMIVSPPILSAKSALIRCTVRASASHVSFCLASIDRAKNQFVSTITPNEGALFKETYQKISDFFLPPSTGFQPLMQVVNTSDTHALTVFLDNWEIIAMDRETIHEASAVLLKESNAPSLTINLPNLPEGAKPIQMALIPAGTFMMGVSQLTPYMSKPDEMPIHRVTLTKDFFMGKCEITQAQYEAVMGNNPSERYGIAPNYPVYRVSWYDAVRFCNALSRLKGLEPVYQEGGEWQANMAANGFRLPTEAEWEYACRAGTTTNFFWGNRYDHKTMDQYAWYLQNSGRSTHGVGQKRPNFFGMVDMIGNVAEWCQDRYGMYPPEHQFDPLGPPTGGKRVLRGSDWDSYNHSCTSHHRAGIRPDLHSSFGIRLCKNIDN
ncbi:SUMF1/EgtB/PvdO family nonheme iron enzyme [bacterium]|nr:SUMF1/EgtB/PvdO family nonheme iron enzyme [bacterium]